MIAAIDLTGVALVITAIAGLVTTVGVAYVSARQKHHGAVLRQVERQGNSVSLELKRTNMVYSRRLAVATAGTLDGPIDKSIADEAQRVYEEAVLAAERDGKLKL